MPMRSVVDSGFEVSVDEDTSFRFAEFAPYKSLSGLHLKEMDVGWWDSGRARIVMLELKGETIWDAFDSSDDEVHEHLVSNLRAKATDVLLMLAASWIGTTEGAKIRALLPARVGCYPGDDHIKLIFLIDTPPARRLLLTPVKDALNRKVAGRTRLFGIKHVTVIDFDKATQLGLPVQRHP